MSQRLTSGDIIGSSSSLTVWWTWSHWGHPSVRMSKPEWPGVTRISVVIVPHTGHDGLCDVVIVLALDQAGACWGSRSPRMPWRIG